MKTTQVYEGTARHIAILRTHLKYCLEAGVRKDIEDLITKMDKDLTKLYNHLI